MKNKPNNLTRSKWKQLDNSEKAKIKIDHIKNKIKTNVDHLIARAEGGSEHGLNKKKGAIRKHECKHGFFGNMKPHEQLIEVLRYNYNTLSPVQRDVIIKEILDIVSKYLEKGEFYNKKCFKYDDPPKEI